MLDKLLYDIAERILGKSGNNIIDILKDKRDVNEFNIAKKLNLTINQTRNLLYRLYAEDIVSFIRKKDKQKGWYIYYWSLNARKALELLARIKEKELLQLSYILKSRKNKNFYGCKDCMIELTEETALNHDFTCPECGNLLKLNEDKKKLEGINKEIEKVKKELEITYNEVNKLREEEEKVKSRREKRELAKKKKEREVRRIVKKKTEKKGSVKKKVKSKVKKKGKVSKKKKPKKQKKVKKGKKPKKKVKRKARKKKG